MGSYPWGPHGPQSGPNEVTPNPTPAWVPPPESPAYYQQSPQPAYYGGAGQNTGYVASGPRKKSYVLALILTLLFGPFGLLYASKKGALVMLALLFAVPISLAAMGAYRLVPTAAPWRVIQYDFVMNRMYSMCVFFCLLWSAGGVYRHNRSIG